jgi:antimicrobial peptide system SdpB family protein
MKLLNKILKNVGIWGDNLSSSNKIFFTFQITRTIIAVASLSTILFSEDNLLFTHSLFENPNLKSSLVFKINMFFILGYNNLFWTKIIVTAILLSVISGYYHKITSVLHWYVSFSLYASLIVVDGGDQIAAIITLLLIPISFCDNRKNTWDNKEKSNNKTSNFISNSILIIIQLQIAVIYLNSGVAKINVAEWMNGSGYYYWFTHNAFGAPNYIKNTFGGLFSNSFIVLLITWGTIIFEIFMFGCLFSKNQTYKRFMLVIGFLFHFLIFIVHGLFSFFLIMFACIIVYLLSNGKAISFTKLKTINHDL